MTSFWSWWCGAALMAVLAAVPPLSESQRVQLADVTDGSRALEEGGLYALLDNALAWEAGDESGARVPDWDALLADPATARGELFLIEGAYAGRSQRDVTGEAAEGPDRVALGRPGPWGETAAQWNVLVSRDPDVVAVVLLADPAGEVGRPGVGVPVRVVGRFYKLWQQRDQAGEPTLYPVFVGRWGQIDRGAMGRLTPTVEPWQWVALAVLLAGALWYALRRAGGRLSLKPQPLPSQVRRWEERELEQVEDEGDVGEPEDRLPEDPAAALEALRRRRQEDEA